MSVLVDEVVAVVQWDGYWEGLICPFPRCTCLGGEPIRSGPKVWRGGGRCGRVSKLTGDNDGWHGCLNPVVRTEEGEILGLYI